MVMKASCPSSIVMGDVLRERNGEKIFFVLKTGDGQRWTHLIDIEHGKPEKHHRASPFKLKTEEVLRRLSSNVEPEQALDLIPRLPVSVAERRRTASHQPNRRSKENIEQAENPTKSRGWELIWRLLTFDMSPNPDGTAPEASLHCEQFEEMLERRTRAKRIARFRETHSYSESTVRRIFRRFCQRGATPAAAGDDYDQCGGKGKVKDFQRKPGRKARGRSMCGAVRNERIRQLLQMAADYYFTAEFRSGKRQSKSLAAAVREIKTRTARRKVFDENGVLIELDFDPELAVTARQLQYFISKKYSYKERRVRKVGLRQYLLHERPLTGRLSDTRGPGQRYHIDATIIDVYPVARRMRHVAVRRPTLYLVVDDWSRMIVGVHLTFDPPCWNGAMAALVNAISPKVEFCKKMALEISEANWPSDRLPEEIYADQGEMSSEHRATPLAVHYRVELSNAPAYRPDLRSIMECRFRILPRTWMPLVPGAVEKDSFARGYRHPALDAALTIDELLLIVVMAILDYNTHAVTGYPTPPEMVEEGVAPTPLNLWRYGTQVNGCGRRVDVAEFRARVMSNHKAEIKGRGISYAGLLYDCPLSLVERQAMFRAEGKAAVVDICFDSSDNSTIDLLGLGEPVPCALADSVPYWKRGLSHHELEIYENKNNENVNDHKADIEVSRAKAEHNVALVARAAVKKTKTVLGAVRLTNPIIDRLDETRDAERSADRASSADDMSSDKTGGVKGAGNVCRKRGTSRLHRVTEGHTKSVGHPVVKSPSGSDASPRHDEQMPIDDEEEVASTRSAYLSVTEEGEARARELFDSVK